MLSGRLPGGWGLTDDAVGVAVGAVSAIVEQVKSSLGTLPAGGGGTLDLTIKQLGQIDFTDLASLKARGKGFRCSRAGAWGCCAWRSPPPPLRSALFAGGARAATVAIAPYAGIECSVISPPPLLTWGPSLAAYVSWEWRIR